MKRSMIVLMGALMLVAAPAVASDEELPTSAKPGECYARVFVPPVYTTSTERVLKNEAAEKIEIIPAKYEWTTEQILVQEASEKLEVVPAAYEWVTEKVMVKPAQTVWKKGTGPIQKIDNHTGEIMCLVEEPAVYESVRKRVLKSPATTRKVTLPAKYDTVKVRKLVSPPQERRVDIPAEYTTITKKSLVTDSTVDWQPVLCQTNMSKDLVISLQRALKGAGYDPGAIDGVIGRQTLTAVRSYQRAKGLASGALTMETLDALNIRIGG